MSHPYLSVTGTIDGYCTDLKAALGWGSGESALPTFILQKSCAMDEWPVW